MQTVANAASLLGVRSFIDWAIVIPGELRIEAHGDASCPGASARFVVY